MLETESNHGLVLQHVAGASGGAAFEEAEEVCG